MITTRQRTRLVIYGRCVANAFEIGSPYANMLAHWFGRYRSTASKIGR